MKGDADINGERDWQAEQPGYHRQEYPRMGTTAIPAHWELSSLCPKVVCDDG